MATPEQEIRMRVMELSLRLPERHAYAGMHAQGGSVGRTAEVVIADAGKILAFITPPTIKKRRR